MKPASARRISSHADGPDVARARRAPRDQRTEWAYIFGAICPAKGKGRRAGHALVRHRRHGGAPHRDQCRRRSRRPCGADRRSGRLALDAQAGDPRQHHRPGAAATIARVEPGGECLAIHARQLVVEPDPSNPTKTSSRCAAKPGTTSSTNPWKIMSLGMRKWAHGF